MVFEVSPQPHFCNPELHVTSASSSIVRLSDCHGNGDVSHYISTEHETAAISLSCTANPSVGDERSAQSGNINAPSVEKEDFNFFQQSLCRGWTYACNRLGTGRCCATTFRRFNFSSRSHAGVGSSFSAPVCWCQGSIRCVPIAIDVSK